MRLSRTALAAFFSAAGILHFVRPRPYEAIVPPPFPKKESVAISGVAELVGGLAVLHPATRPASRWGLIALLLAVFPANVWMAVSPHKIPGAAQDPALGALGPPAASAAGDALGLARHRRLSLGGAPARRR